MINPGLFNAEFRVVRHTVTGSDYGTPITVASTATIVGWFDEPNAANRVYSTQRQGTSVIPTVNRKAMFAVLPDAGLRHDDEGEVFAGGVSMGRWTVEKIDSVPAPGGLSHFEALLSKLEEGR